MLSSNVFCLFTLMIDIHSVSGKEGMLNIFFQFNIHKTLVFEACFYCL